MENDGQRDLGAFSHSVRGGRLQGYYTQTQTCTNKYTTIHTHIYTINWKVDRHTHTFTISTHTCIHIAHHAYAPACTHSVYGLMCMVGWCVHLMRLLLLRLYRSAMCMEWPYHWWPGRSNHWATLVGNFTISRNKIVVGTCVWWCVSVAHAYAYVSFVAYTYVSFGCTYTQVCCSLDLCIPLPDSH